MEHLLKNKTAIIGGSSSGIGKAVAISLAQEGCRVVVCGRNQSKVTNTIKEINKKYHAHAIGMCIDQTNASDIKRLVSDVIKKFKRIDILITNTGGPRAGDFFELSEDDWRNAHELLFLYVVRVYKDIIPIMKKQMFGRIINNTSFTVKEPSENLILSNVYRTAIISLAKTLARELAKYNITINNICPGFVDTDRLRELFEIQARKNSMPIEEVYSNAIANMPIGRLQKPEEIANTIVFLASEKAGTITGTTIPVDGGMLRGLF